VSQSPDAAGSQELDDYARGWSAINKLMRRGYSWSGHEKNCAYLNLGPDAAGSPRFADVSAVSGFDFGDDARALATIDWDHDGDLDVLVTNRGGPRLRFLENRQATRNQAVTLRPAHADGTDAIGATVEVELEGRGPIMRGLRAGEGYLAQSSSWLTFGLGEAAIVGVTVRWPGAQVESFTGVERGGRYTLLRGSGRAQPQRVPATRPLAATPATVREFLGVEREHAARAAQQRLVLAAPVPVPELALHSGDGQRIGLFGIEAGGQPRGTGRPVLLNIWSSACAPCLSELADFQAHADAVNDAGIAFLAVSVDADRDAAAEALSRLDWPWPWALAEPETIEILDVLQGALRDTEERLALPTSFLFDGAGNLRLIYFGPLAPEDLLSDLKLLELPPERVRDAAVPFRGTWYSRSFENDLAFFEGRFEARGLSAAAGQYSRGRIEVRQTSRAKLLADFGRRSASQGRLEEAIGTLREAIDLDPRLFQAHFDLAVIFHREERLLEAISAYLQALAIEPDHEDARFNLGLAYLASGDLAASRLQLEALQKSRSRLAATLEREIVRREE